MECRIGCAGLFVSQTCLRAQYGQGALVLALLPFSGKFMSSFRGQGASPAHSVQLLRPLPASATSSRTCPSARGAAPSIVSRVGARWHGSQRQSHTYTHAAEKSSARRAFFMADGRSEPTNEEGPDVGPSEAVVTVTVSELAKSWVSPAPRGLPGMLAPTEN